VSNSISSLQNPRIKAIRALVDRKARDETGLFVVEGARMLAEAASANAAIETLVVAPELLSDPRGIEAVATLERRGAPRLEVTADVFRGLSRRRNPKALAAVVRQRWEPLETVQLAGDQFGVALFEIGDPGNLGTILRTCDAVGVAAVFLIGDATDPHHPTALSASTGAIFTQRLVRTTLSDLAEWKQAHGYTIVGTAPGSGRDYREASYARPLVLLMGSESSGLSDRERAICDLLVSIPMVGRVSALNLAVATGLLLYELFNPRPR
jgi:RNA methyltransferase, TrmH family